MNISWMSNVNIVIVITFISIVLYFIYEGSKFKKNYSRRKWLIWIIVRIALIVCLFLIFTNASINMKPKYTTTIFLVDESLSVNKYKKEVKNYINEQIKNKSRHDKYAVIGFGKENAIEIPLTSKIGKIELNAQLNNNFTDIEKALDFAKDYFPKKNNKRLVIITDEKENIGKGSSKEKELRDENVNLLVYKIGDNVKNDVQITNMIIPNIVHKNENLPIQVIVDSTGTYEGMLYLNFNNGKVLEKNINVKEGKNTFEILVPVTDSGKLTVKSEIDFKDDFNKLNNLKTVARNIEDSAVVLVIGEEVDVKNINTLLDSIKVSRKNCLPNEVINNVSFLTSYDEIILVNTSYKNLPENFDENLEKAVKEFGTGLLVVGGDNSFALGGYEKTTLEKILPVQCKMKDNRKDGNTGLVLLIDCSGSMKDESSGIQKIEIAKQAAIESINALENEDYLGILAFSDTLEWVVPFGQVKNKQDLIKNVENLNSKGGTLIIPSLVEGIKALEKAPVKIKHMILLTDGQAEKNGYEKFITNMKNSNITMSTVAVGMDSEKEILENLAEAAGGRKYVSKEFTDVPKIFSKETYISTKKYLNNEEFIPQIVSNKFFNYKSLPKLKGFMGTGIKSRGELILKSITDDPICAYWKYGMGDVVTWTSDLNGAWSSEWINWSEFTNAWSGTINYLLKSKSGKNIDFQIEPNGCSIKLLAEYKNYDEKCKAELIVNEPDGKETKVSLKNVRNDKFVYEYDLDKLGEYIFSIEISKENTIVDKSTKSLYLDYSPEYNIEKNNKNNKLSELSYNSKVIEAGDNIFKDSLTVKNYAYTNLEFILIPLSLVLFFIDIAIRLKGHSNK